jgi:PAS domain S-box-containing protein
MNYKKEDLDVAQRDLRRSEERYHRMIAEVSDYAIILLSPEGIIENWNKGAENIKGYTAKEIIGKSFREFYTDEDRIRKLPESLLEEAIAKGRATHEGWRVRKDGTRFWGSIVITALHDDVNKVIGFSKVTRDLTERKRAEDRLRHASEEMLEKNRQLENTNAQLEKNSQSLELLNRELKKSEERYHQMIAEVTDYAILLLSPAGIIENWNKGAESIKGYKASEIVGKHFRIFYEPGDQQAMLPERLIDIARREGKATHEGWRIRKDGTKFWGSIVITALHDQENNIIGFSKVTRDLSDKKIADDQLKDTSERLALQNRELERMNQELTSFAYVSSHDLQEPLRKIQTFITRIAETESDSLSDRGKDYFARIQNAANRMQTLIDDLLTYSRTNTDERKIERADLNAILDDVKSELREKIDDKRATIKSDKLPTVDVVAFQFRQLFLNLIGNSLKFSKVDTRPEIQITCEVISGDTVPDHAYPKEKSFYHFTVVDNGIGFEPEYNSKIFEVFQRLHGRSEYSGTGIGLAICKKIAENHGGCIRAEGAPGVGAAIHIYLPKPN